MRKYLFFVFCILFSSLDNVEAQCASLTCFASLNMSLDPNGKAKVTPDLIFFGDDSACSLLIGIVDSLGNEVLPFDDFVALNCDYLGPQVVVLRDAMTLSECWSTLNITDPLGVCGQTSTVDLYKSAPYFSQNTLYFDLWDTEGSIVLVHDLSGRLVYSVKPHQGASQMDLSFLPMQELYIVTIEKSNERKSLKIIPL